MQSAANGSYALIKEMGLPLDFARLQIAQWVFESGWGSAVTGDYNHFGLTWSKADPRPCKLCPTYEDVTTQQFNGFSQEERYSATEMDGSPLKMPWVGSKKIRMKRNFVSFQTPKESFKAHMDLLQKGKPYRSAIENYKTHHNIYEFVKEIGPIYATDTSYTTKIITMMNSSELKNALAISVAGLEGNNNE